MTFEHNYKQIMELFVKELHDASHGRKTTLPYLVHHLPHKPTIQQPHKQFMVLIFGGSTYTKVLCNIQKEGVTIESIEKGDVPLLPTKKDLYAFMSQCIEPMTQYLTLGFAYPLKPVLRDKEILDGILVAGAKENTFEGLVGQMVGESIELYMKEQGRPLTIHVVNDSICALLGALHHNERGATMCFIAGTGTNSAFFANDKNAINVQSGEFNTMPLSPTGVTIDKQSMNPGTYSFEKEMGGKYLFQHYNLSIKEQFPSLSPIPSTKELNIIAKDDTHPACHIARDLWQRSASLTATQIAGIMEFKQQDMHCLMVGSLWDAYHYQDTVKHMIKELTSYQVTLYTQEYSEINGCVNLLTGSYLI